MYDYVNIEEILKFKFLKYVCSKSSLQVYKFINFINYQINYDSYN